MGLVSYRSKFDGLDAFKVKVIACLCMTVDHIGAFMSNSNSFIMEHYTLFRIVGRIAAPLFLFILTQSIRYTSNKFNLLKRLYLAGVLTGLANTVFNIFCGNIFGIHNFGNIFFTFFYVTFYSVLGEKLTSAIKMKNIRECVKIAFAALLSLLPCVLYKIIDQAVPSGMSITQRLLIQGVEASFLPAVDRVEYGLGFIILGIVLYFSKKKVLQCLVYSIFCAICICGAFVARTNFDICVGSSFASLYFDPLQCWMFLALPIMMLYNKRRGIKAKAFFYWYYPVHQYLFVIISTIG